MKMVKALYAHQRELPNGKALPMSDLEMLRTAEKLLYNEFNYVLHMEKDKVLSFIMGEFQAPAREII